MINFSAGGPPPRDGQIKREMCCGHAHGAAVHAEASAARDFPRLLFLFLILLLQANFSKRVNYCPVVSDQARAASEIKLN